MKVFIKEYPSHLYAHIYEHIIANRIHDSLIDDRLIRVIDYDIDWRTSDNFIFVRLDNLDDTVLKDSTIDTIEVGEINRAAIGLSCEYKRPVKVLNSDKIVKTLNKINTTPWYEADDIEGVKVKYSTNIFRQSDIVYSRVNSKEFISVDFVYYLSEEFDELVPLAAYVFQVIALNQVLLFYKKVNCYDIGDEWNSWGDYVGYSSTLVFPKEGFIGKDGVKGIFEENLRLLLNDFGFSDKLVKYLQDTKYEKKFFTPLSLIEYSGYLIGKNGWKKLATKENIQTVLDNMKIDITVKKD